MKIKYHEWKCLVCGNISRFTGKDIFSEMPYWFTIRTEGCVSSSERPSFNTTVCSIPCLEKASEIIDDSIKNHTRSIPNKKDIEATICDECGKVAKSDSLNLVCGPGPLRDWTYEKTPAGRKDFCCEGCKRNNSLHPEESVFANLKRDRSWEIARLIKVIDSPNLKEAVKSLSNDSGIKVKFPELPLS